MLGFGAPRKTSFGTSGGGGGFIRPRTAPTRAVAAPRAVTSSRAIAVVPRADYVSHYDPSRVVDLDRLKVVTDMRQSGAERGELQTGDNGVMSPSEDRTGTITAPGGVPGDTGPGEPATKNNLIPLAIGAAALFLLGG